VLRNPVPVMAGAAALVLAAIAVVPTLGRSFLPEFQEGTLVISAITVPGTSLDESDALGRRMEQILLAHPAVEETARRTGPRGAGRARAGRERRRDRRAAEPRGSRLR
jgi:Cu/Ag efflux pump CusA